MQLSAKKTTHLLIKCLHIFLLKKPPDLLQNSLCISYYAASYTTTEHQLNFGNEGVFALYSMFYCMNLDSTIIIINELL